MSSFMDTLGISFDDAAKQFITDRSLFKNGENKDNVGKKLDSKIEENKNSYKSLQETLTKLQGRKPETVRLRDVRTDIKEGGMDNLKYYNQELSLRNNLAAASDIAIIEILREHGVIYLDPDFLPEFDPSIFDSVDLSSIKINAKAHKMQAILDVLNEEGQFPERARLLREGKYAPLNIEDMPSGVYEDMKNAVRQRLKEGGDIFKPLGDINTAEMGIRLARLGGAKPSNAAISAHRGSIFLDRISEDIGKRYEFIETHKYDLTDGYTDPETISPEFPESAAYGPEYGFSMGNLTFYRLDGVAPGSESAIHSTGPSALTQSIYSTNHEIFNGMLISNNRLDNDLFTFQNFEYLTEEENVHTWKADEHIDNKRFFATDYELNGIEYTAYMGADYQIYYSEKGSNEPASLAPDNHKNLYYAKRLSSQVKTEGHWDFPGADIVPLALAKANDISFDLHANGRSETVNEGANNPLNAKLFRIKGLDGNQSHY